MPSDFGKTLKALREQNGWTLEEMATRLETTKQALSKYERGERTPKITVAKRFSDILNIPLEELVGAEELDAQAIADQPKNNEVRLLLQEMNKMTPEQIEQVKGIFKIIFNMKGKEEDDA